MPNAFEQACKMNESEEIYKMLSGTQPGVDFRINYSMFIPVNIRPVSLQHNSAHHFYVSPAKVLQNIKKSSNS